LSAELVRGGLSVDDRGEVGFVNDFDFADVKRFYTVSNHRQGFVRAWHAHRNEAKYVLAVSGACLVCCVEVDDWERPSPELEVQRFVLSERQPAVLRVPAGYANGFMTLTADAKLMYFSTATLEDSLGDDVRFPARHWDPWTVEER
jgi:dTDP-4-dehydrorhamnose 3,5-epimerase-like enzyme